MSYFLFKENIYQHDNELDFIFQMKPPFFSNWHWPCKEWTIVCSLCLVHLIGHLNYEEMKNTLLRSACMRLSLLTLTLPRPSRIISTASRASHSRKPNDR